MRCTAWTVSSSATPELSSSSGIAAVCAAAGAGVAARRDFADAERNVLELDAGVRRRAAAALAAEAASSGGA